MATDTATPTARTMPQIVAETIEGAQHLGVPVSEEALENRFKVIGLSDFSGSRAKIKAVVTSTPVTYNEQYAGFEPRFDGHLGTILFGLNVVEERKLDSLFHAYDQYGDENGLDLGYVSRFTMRADRLVTVTQPVPDALPMKGDEIDVVIERTGEMDELGQEILSVVAFTVPPAKQARSLRRRQPINTADAADDTTPDEA